MEWAITCPMWDLGSSCCCRTGIREWYCCSMLLPRYSSQKTRQVGNILSEFLFLASSGKLGFDYWEHNVI